MKTIDYYMSPASPWTYLGHARFAEIAKKRGATVTVKPSTSASSSRSPAACRCPSARRSARPIAWRKDYLGAPSYVYRDEIFWGQDRLDFLDRALAK